jgi:hypothetical protein
VGSIGVTWSQLRPDCWPTTSSGLLALDFTLDPVAPLPTWHRGGAETGTFAQPVRQEW